LKTPDRGDLITLDFDPQAGHEQKKRRPALVLSPAPFNEVFGLAYVAPITSKPRGHAFEVPLPAGSNVRGVVLVHQLKSLDWRMRRARAIGTAPPSVVRAAAEIVVDIVEGEP
jgi:mRNA interferase MazF